jgi:hypothetical protein
LIVKIEDCCLLDISKNWKYLDENGIHGLYLVSGVDLYTKRKLVSNPELNRTHILNVFPEHVHFIDVYEEQELKQLMPHEFL